MDELEQKSALKSARNLLGSGDKSQEALVQIRNVLKVDGENYQALVLEGAALQKLGKYPQSLQSYKKAIAVNPKNLMAWQGVLAHYEKRGIHQHDDLIEAYKRISQHYEKNEDKSQYLEAMLKYVGQLQSQHLLPQCIRVLQRLIKSNGINKRISQMAVGILSQITTLEPDEEEMYLNCLENLHETESSTDHQYRKYFQLLYKVGDYKRLETVCRDLNPRFNTFFYPIDYLCRLYTENHLSPDGIELAPVYVDKLFKLYPSSTFACFAQGKLYYEVGAFVDSIAWLKQGIESKCHEEAIYVLILALGRIWDFEGVEEYCLKIVNRDGLKDPNRFWIHLAHSYVFQKKYKEAALIVQKLPPNMNQVQVLKALVCWGEENFEGFQTYRQSLTEIDWRVELCHVQSMKEADNSTYVKLAEMFPTNFDLLFSCGIELSKYSDFDDAFFIFSKCLEISRNHPILLAHFGKLFIENEDYERGLSNLQLAYKCLPSPEIGMQLSDLYFITGDNEANKAFLKQATKNFKKTKSKWAWLRLGMLYLELNEPVEAVSALQSAIRTDVADCHVWETLAEAYYARGSYEASLKAFEHSLKLGAEPTYPKLKIGVIQRHLGEEEKSLQILSEFSDYTPALVELSKTWLQIAHKNFEDGLSLVVINAINECIKAATRVLKSSERDLALTIITESIILAGDLNRDSMFEVPASLFCRQPDSEGEVVQRPLRKLLHLGLNCALTVCNFADSKHVKAFQHFLAAKICYKLALNFSEATIGKGVYHAKKAVSLCQSNYTYWNTLGVIAEVAGDTSLSLHSYLKSIEKNPTGSALTWTNLGLLLLSNGDLGMAHACFTQAQRFEPSYAHCWIGQALVAQSVADEVEAMDLFRHAVGLEQMNIHGNFCYAFSVCRALLQSKDKNDHHYKYSIEHLDAVHFALEKIQLYNGRFPSAASLTLQGILQVEIGLHESALRSFDRASCLTTISDELLPLELNKITTLQKLGRYEDVLRRIHDLDSSQQSFKLLAHKALSLEKVGDLEKAYDVYRQMLDVCATQAEKSDVLISQGLVSYRLHGLEQAKTLLFQGCKLSSSPAGYVALCSLALVENDLYLADSVVAKVAEKFIKPEHIHNIALLKSFSQVASGAEGTAPLRSILSFIHKYPGSGKLWTVLGNHFINIDTNGEAARRALLSASLLGEEATLPSIALTYLLEENYEKALKIAQSAMFHNPTCTASLSIMVAALSAREATHGLFEGSNCSSVKLADKALRITSDKPHEKELHHEKLRQWIATFLYTQTH